MSENPAVAASLTLLSLPAEEWKRRALVDSWHSQYFDFSELGVDAGSAALLDEISRTGRVVQGLSQWHEAFELWEKKKTMANEEGELIPEMNKDELIREKFELLVDLLTPPSRASMKEFVAFVESLIGDDPAGLDTWRLQRHYSTSDSSTGLNRACCTAAPGYVWANKAEIEALAAVLRIEVKEFERRYIRKVGIRLVARTAQPDRTTGQIRRYVEDTEIVPRNMPYLPQI